MSQPPTLGHTCAHTHTHTHSFIFIVEHSIAILTCNIKQKVLPKQFHNEFNDHIVAKWEKTYTRTHSLALLSALSHTLSKIHQLQEKKRTLHKESERDRRVTDSFF